MDLKFPCGQSGLCRHLSSEPTFNKIEDGILRQMGQMKSDQKFTLLKKSACRIYTRINTSLHIINVYNEVEAITYLRRVIAKCGETEL